MTLSEAVAQVIRGELAEREWHSDDFAEKAGRKKTTGWRHVKGKARMSIDDVEAYAVALGWTLPYMLDRANEKRRQGAGPMPPAEHLIGNMVTPEFRAAVEDVDAEVAERRRKGQPNG